MTATTLDEAAATAADPVLAKKPLKKRKDPLGHTTGVSLSSRPGRILVYALMVFWTVPTFGIAISSIRPEAEVKTSGWWNWFRSPSFTLDNYQRVLSSAPGEDNMGQAFLNSLKITVPSGMRNA